MTFFIAVKVGGVAVATLGFASFPAFIALLDIVIFRERIGVYEGVLPILVTIGLVLVTPSFDSWRPRHHRTHLGTGLRLVLCRSCHDEPMCCAGMDAMQVAFGQNVVVALLVAPFAMGGLAEATPTDWLYLAPPGVFCTRLSQYLFVKSLEGLSARHAGMIIALEPIYAIACAWWLFSETPSLRMLAGAALIISAIVLSARGRGPQNEMCVRDAEQGPDACRRMVQGATGR